MREDFELVEVLWEHRMIDDAREHYLKAIENKSLVETKLGEMLLQQLAETTKKEIKKRQQQATSELLNKGGRRLPWKELIVMIPSQEAAFSTVQALMSSLATNKPPTYQKLCLELAESFEREIRFFNWTNDDKGYAAYFLRKNRQALSSKSQHLRFTRRLEKKIDDYLDGDQYDLTREAMFSLGAVLLHCVKIANPDMMSFTAKGPSGKMKAQTVFWSDVFLDDINKLHAVASVAQPIRRPMLVPPRNWVRKQDGRIEGGYYLLKQKVYRTDWHPHRFDPSESALDSLNTIQKTPWMVNEKVLDFCTRFPTIGPQLPFSKPHKLSKDDWDKLNEQDRKVVQQKFNDDLASFVSQTSKAMTFERQILQAEMLRGKVFWQPHAFDFRGRLYPSNQMLTSQGDHVSKALIRFANGKPLGEHGLRALKVHCANVYGFDKLDLQDREYKIDEMADLIQTLSINDYEASRIIKQADEPLAFYAAALELSEALNSPDPTKYISHLPVAVDGTCNGLQILSLLGKDRVGAEKTNCTAVSTRKDLYQEVANAVREIIEQVIEADECELEVSAAHAWYEKMQDDRKSRKVVKRAVMTTAYGVTKEGIREQLVNDRMVDDLTIPDCYSHLPILQARHRLAGHMRDWIIRARGEIVSEAVKIMDYIKDTAKVLAENQYPLSWVTPDGCEVSQNYVVLQDKVVRTFDNWMRRLRKRTDKLTPHKNAGAAAPNLVHSLDATMARLVALALKKHGITDMAFVHDSYAVHACYLEDLNRILREVAVEMFKGDWLTDSLLWGLIEMVDGTVDLPIPPQQGELDIESELPKATYFFS